jgi:hypothetical protein
MFLRLRDLEILALKELFKMLQDTTGLFKMFLMNQEGSLGLMAFVSKVRILEI